MRPSDSVPRTPLDPTTLLKIIRITLFLIKFLIILPYAFIIIFLTFLICYNESAKFKLTKTALHVTTKSKLYSAKMLTGHGFYPIGDSHEQRRHSWFSKSRVAPTAPEIRLGLGLGSTFCRGYSGITFNIGSDSACLIVIPAKITNIARPRLAPRDETYTAIAEVRTKESATAYYTALPIAHYSIRLLKLKDIISGQTITAAPITTAAADVTPPDDRSTQRCRSSPCLPSTLILPHLKFTTYSHKNIAPNTLKLTKLGTKRSVYEKLTANPVKLRRGYIYKSRLILNPVYNQFLSQLNTITTLYRSNEYPISPRKEPDTNQLSCPGKGTINLLDKLTHNVFSTEIKKIKACNKTISYLQGHTRDDTQPHVFPKERTGEPGSHYLATKYKGNYVIPVRYYSRTYCIHIIIFTQSVNQATPNPVMQGIIPTPRMAIRHPAVTTRQLLPRDSALIHPEIQELDTPHHPSTVSFLVLAREITPSKTEAGVLSLPICHTIWDFPDPVVFYDVLQQVVELLEPHHRKHGALITAASASEALGICIIQIKNKFGHSMDFVRRAFRGAHIAGARLETFPLDAFLPPTAIHLSKPWSKGMKRYYNADIIKHQPNL